MKSAIEFHEELKTAADQAVQDLRQHSGMKAGKVGHQGDVYVHCITAIPEAWNVEVSEHRQVALGNAIGSRHVAEGDALTVFWPKSKDEAMKQCPIKDFFVGNEQAKRLCLGPIVKADKAWTLTHPEHAHHQFPAGTYLVTYQFDFNTQQIVRD